MKIYKFKGTRLIIPREHIPFILLPLVEIRIAWAHIPLQTGELIKSNANPTYYKPMTPLVFGVNSPEYFKEYADCPQFVFSFAPYCNLNRIQFSPQYPF